MGYFRRYKLSDYTADECREKMREMQRRLATCVSLTPVLEEWACFRELLARHEGENVSPLDVEDEEGTIEGFTDVRDNDR